MYISPLTPPVSAKGIILPNQKTA